MGKSPTPPSADYYSEQEATQRREAALRRMLRTPPQPRSGTSRSKGQESEKSRRKREKARK